MAKKTITIREAVTEEQEILRGTIFCVKIKIFENGFLKKMEKRIFFKSLKEAEKAYESTFERGRRIELSRFEGGNEHILQFKDC